MSKIWKIAVTEYLNYVRSKGFIVGILLLPIMMGGSILVQYLTRDKVDLVERKVAVLDETGRLFPLLQKAATIRNEKETKNAQGTQNRPLFSFEEVTSPIGDPAVLDLELSDKVRAKQLFAYVKIGPDALNDVSTLASNSMASVLYHTQTPSYMELPQWIEQTLSDEIQRIRMEKAGLDFQGVRSLLIPLSVTRMGLVSRDGAGKIGGARKENTGAALGVPIGALVLLFILVMTSAPALLNAVLEEKMQKIAELLVSAVTPFELMLGKLFGLSMVSLTLSALYLGSAAFMLHRFNALAYVPPQLFAWFLFFQIIALFIYGSVFCAIGAACSEMKDAQNLMGPAMMILMVPMFTLAPVLQSPNSSFSTMLSFFPPATPMIMLMRIAIQPGPPLWEVVLGAAFSIVFMLVSIWAGGKIFRIGILSQGQTPTIGTMMKWIFSK